MKYEFYPSRRVGVKPYKPEYIILDGPDKSGACKCLDEKINNVAFFNIKDLRPIKD